MVKAVKEGRPKGSFLFLQKALCRAQNLASPIKGAFFITMRKIYNKVVLFRDLGRENNKRMLFSLPTSLNKTA